MRAAVLFLVLTLCGCVTRNAPLITVETTDNVNVNVKDSVNGNTAKAY